jgi:hypothetical protein
VEVAGQVVVVEWVVVEQVGQDRHAQASQAEQVEQVPVQLSQVVA